MQPRAQSGKRVRHPLPAFRSADGPGRLSRTDPRPQQVRDPLLAVAAGDPSEGRDVVSGQVLDAERAQQHRRGRRVRHGVRRSQRLAERPGDSAPVLRRPCAQNAVPERLERRHGGLRARYVAGQRHLCERVKSPGGRRFGAVGEGLLAGPHDNGRPVVPAVERVAPVAHVALVLRGIGLEVIRPGGRAHLVGADVQRGRFQPVAVRAGPVRERDVDVDQFLDIVVGRAVRVLVLVLVVLIPVALSVPVAVIRLVGAVRRLDVGEREDSLVPRPLGRGP